MYVGGQNTLRGYIHKFTFFGLLFKVTKQNQKASGDFCSSFFIIRALNVSFFCGAVLVSNNFFYSQDVWNRKEIYFYWFKKVLVKSLNLSLSFSFSYHIKNIN